MPLDPPLSVVSPPYEDADPLPEEGSPLPPPPGLGEDDFVRTGKHAGRLRCFASSKQRLRALRDRYPDATDEELAENARCQQPAVDGSHLCRFHGAGGAPKHPDDPAAVAHEGSRARARKIEAVRTHLENVAEEAVEAVRAILTDEFARPQDRLKAAELVLDRTVGKQLTLDRENAEERDLDREIEELVSALAVDPPDPPAGELGA